MKCLNYIFLALLVMFCTNCQKSTEPIGNDKPPPGYQEDIPWPSLADSPWPMNHGDPQSTGRSKFTGPINGSVIKEVGAISIQSGVSIGPDSTIYYGASGDLIAMRPNGKIKWKIRSDGYWELNSTPLVGSDGTIYFGTGDGKVFAVNPDSTIKWQVPVGGNIWQSLTIDLNGNLYVVDYSSTLHCISSDGKIKWSLTDNRFNSYPSAVMSFSPNGKTLYLPGRRVALISLDLATTTIKWDFGERGTRTQPVVDSNENIYILTKIDSVHNGKSSVFSLNKMGEINWSYPCDDDHSGMNTPTIDKQGNIYVAYDTLYSFDYNGNLRWQTDLGLNCDCPVVCDNMGNVFVGSMGSGFEAIEIRAYSSDGNLIWSIKDYTQYQVGGSPALVDNLLYFPTWESSKLYIIE
ncbi:PQQ-like beta-propeller repeat protein [bacterium]|nr:PQQ-like beta-propeller repeat protein [bacterium]